MEKLDLTQIRNYTKIPHLARLTDTEKSLLFEKSKVLIDLLYNNPNTRHTFSLLRIVKEFGNKNFVNLKAHYETHDYIPPNHVSVLEIVFIEQCYKIIQWERKRISYEEMINPFLIVKQFPRFGEILQQEFRTKLRNFYLTLMEYLKKYRTTEYQLIKKLEE